MSKRLSGNAFQLVSRYILKVLEKKRPVGAGEKIIRTDEKGNKATLTIADLYQSNGVIHVFDAVVLHN